MPIKTLLEFATDKMLTRLLAKERAKQRGRNRSDKQSFFQEPAASLLFYYRSSYKLKTFNTL